MAFKLHKIIYSSRKKNLKKTYVCLPYLKIFRSVTRNTLNFFIWPKLKMGVYAYTTILSLILQIDGITVPIIDPTQIAFSLCYIHAMFCYVNKMIKEWYFWMHQIQVAFTQKSTFFKLFIYILARTDIFNRGNNTQTRS